MFYTGIGSRETPQKFRILFGNLAGLLEKRGYILRSGAADGADSFFEDGVFNPENKEIWIPHKGFRGHTSKLLPSPEAFDILLNEIGYDGPSKYHAFHARNIHQVLGIDLRTPSRFVLCWTPGGKRKGGTRTAIGVAKSHGIPVYNFGSNPDKVLRQFWGDFIDQSYDSQKTTSQIM